MVSSLYISFQGRTLELERRPDPLKENGAEIQVSGFYCNQDIIFSCCNSTVIFTVFFGFISFPIQIFINMQIARVT